MKLISPILCSLLLFCSAARVQAEELSFRMVAPKVMRVGEQFELKFVMNQKVDDFQPAQILDFQFLGGPSTSQSSSMSYVNGEMVHTRTITYSYYYRASKPGKFIIDGATAVYKKTQVKTNSLEIEVVGGQAGAADVQEGNMGSEAKANSGGEDLFVRFFFSKKAAYVGEQITAWVKIYTKVQLQGVDQNFKGPEYTGFYKQDVQVPQLTGLEREKVGDDVYHAGMLRKVVLYPQKSGKITIPSFSVDAYIPNQARRSNPFDDFFGRSSHRKVQLKTEPVTLTVKDLPGNKPQAFSGSVGQFQMGAQLNQNKVNSNEAITFKVDISGKGNIKLIEGLVYDLPATFEAFDPVIKTQLNESTNGTTGKKTYEITAIPRHAGNFEIKPFKFSYFDPATGAYKTLHSQAFNIEVAKSGSDTSQVMITNLSKEDIELLASDIRYIKTELKLTPSKNFIFGRASFYFLYLLILVVFASVLLVWRKQVKLNADVAAKRNKAASKQAKKALKAAALFMRNQEEDKFYEEISRAMWGYLGNKLNLQASDLSTELVRGALLAKNVEESIVNEYLELISSCEFMRYAPASQKLSLEETYKKASQVILRIDQKI